MKYNKIYIFGGPGVGKTTLANLLANTFNEYKVIHLDSIMFDNFGSKRTEIEMTEILKNEISDVNNWIIEGGTLGWSDFVFDEIDILLYLEAPTVVSLYRIIARHIKTKRHSLLSTFKLCTKTLPAYKSKKIMGYVKSKSMGKLQYINNASNIIELIK